MRVAEGGGAGVEVPPCIKISYRHWSPNGDLQLFFRIGCSSGMYSHRVWLRLCIMTMLKLARLIKPGSPGKYIEMKGPSHCELYSCPKTHLTNT